METIGDQVLHACDQENWTASTYESEEEYRFVDHEDDDGSLQILLREFLEELNLEGRELFEKLISRVEKDATIERLLRKALRDFEGRSGSHMLEKFLSKLNNRGAKSSTITERGVGGDVSTGEFKLERFKVKTVNAIGSGVVKEEGQ